MYFLGLPDWVFSGAIGLLLAGLPIMVVTGLHERRRVDVRLAGTRLDARVGLGRQFTWGKAIRNGGLAFGGLAFAAGGFMASRHRFRTCGM